MTEPQPPSPAAAPGQSAPPQGQPPFGSSPATGPTQNLGHVSAGMSMLALATQILAQAVPLLGVSSEPAQDALDAIKKLSKHAPPGSVSEADKKNQLQSMLLKQQQQAPQMAAMKAAQPAAQPAAPQPQAA